MLTLRELKNMVAIPERGLKIPTSKFLRENGAIVAKQRLKDGVEIIAYSNGYAVYRAYRRSTVISIHLCADYQYKYCSECAHVATQIFDKEAWYIRLILEGEDRLNHNQQIKEREWNISYSVVSEDWSIMQNTEETTLDDLIRREKVNEVLQLLTERQRMIVNRVFLAQKTQKEIAKELGISNSAVSIILAQAIKRIRKKYVN